MKLEPQYSDFMPYLEADDIIDFGYNVSSEITNLSYDIIANSTEVFAKPDKNIVNTLKNSQTVDELLKNLPTSLYIYIYIYRIRVLTRIT
ncbi:MAG: hypothetical protein LBU73_01800 [Helicobacteraceae bacterium]|jgi:hypothetical protein|nr:hypothetical protein [Helicobacteraceae bacterium]